MAFVSLWHISPSVSLAQSTTKDELADFEAELDASEKATAPSARPTPRATPAPKLPPKKPAPSAPVPSATPLTTPSPSPAVTPTATPAETPKAKPTVTPSETPPVATEPSQDIEGLKKEIRSSAKNPALITKLGQELYKKGEYEKVTLLLWKHVDIIDRQGLLTLAKAHEKRKESGEMIRALNLLIGKDEKDFEAYTLMGQAHVIAKKNREALDNFKKATELNPRYEPAYEGLISLYEKREPPNLYELRILYQDLIDNIGSRPQYLHKLCEINTLDSTYEAAIQSCREAIAKDGKKADSHVYLGLSLKATGDDAGSLKILKQAAANYTDSEFAQYQYAKVLEEQKNFVDAMKLFKRATEIDPKAARSWLGLATTAFEIRKYDIALIAYGQACRYDQKTAVAFRRATTVLRNQKDSAWVNKFEDASETCTFKN